MIQTDKGDRSSAKKSDRHLIPDLLYDQQRTYGGANLNPDGREAIFAYWLAQDAKMYH